MKKKGLWKISLDSKLKFVCFKWRREQKLEMRKLEGSKFVGLRQMKVRFRGKVFKVVYTIMS